MSTYLKKFIGLYVSFDDKIISKSIGVIVGLRPSKSSNLYLKSNMDLVVLYEGKIITIADAIQIYYDIYYIFDIESGRITSQLLS